MRWFKHFSDNHRGQSIQALMDEHGHMGPCCYFFLMEMCAEKLEKNDSSLAPVFIFHEKLVRQVFRTNRRSFLPLLETYQKLGLLVFRTSGNFIEIEMPILLNLLDRDLKKPRLKRANDAPKARLDKELDKDKEEELEREVATVDVALPRLAIIWNMNCRDLSKVIKSNNQRNRKAMIRIKDHTEAEWIDIVNRISLSQFCSGKNDRGWKATFDWLLQPETSLKVLEGKYDDKAKIQDKDLFSLIDFGDQAS